MASDPGPRFHMPAGTQNIARILQRRRQGIVPPYLGGGVIGGQTNVMSASAEMRNGCRGGSYGFQRSMKGHPSMVPRLRHSATLRGHTRCVNRLCWNEGGTRIASGSDDTTVCIFDAASGARDLQFWTGHSRNILGIKILPCTNDQAIVTGAIDEEVRLHTAPFSDPSMGECVFAYGGRVNAIEVEPGNPFIFWAASDRGTVRQFDRRMSYPTQMRHINEVGAGTCLIALPNESHRSGSCSAATSPAVSAPGRYAHASPPQDAGRAMHLACNPINTNYLAVACGDLIARVYDRRLLSVGTAPRVRSRSAAPPAFTFCPPHEHPAGGKSRGCLADSRSRTRSPFVEGKHATCVAFSPDGRSLLVSFHRDNVYLFDATGARRNGADLSDPALSSYFLPPVLSPPSSAVLSPPRFPQSIVNRPLDGMPNRRNPGFEGGGTGFDTVGGQGGSRGEKRTRWSVKKEPTTADLKDRVILRRGRYPTGRSKEASGLIENVLEAHCALATWDGRGAAPVTLAWLSELYLVRSSKLRERGWKGDGYMALLDAARAKELLPTAAHTVWEYIKCLDGFGRHSAARAEALRYLPSFPELRPTMEAFLGVEFSDDALHEGRLTSGEEDARGKEEKEILKTGQENDEENRSQTSSRGRTRAPSCRDDDDAHYQDESGSPPPQSVLDADILLASEVAVAREWHIRLSRKGDVGVDVRCPGPDSDDIEKIEHAVAGRAAQETDVEFPRRPLDQGHGSPHAMIQRYAGACNVQTGIKEASFFGDGPGGYIAAGSDDGRMYMWERESGRLVMAVEADENIVNCVAPHPSLPVIATSGLEEVVRLWSPMGDEEATIGEDKNVKDRRVNRGALNEAAQTNHGNLNADATWASQSLFQLIAQMSADRGGTSSDGEIGPECAQA